MFLNYPKIPIWLMRQAGRYLPEYMALRSQTKNFLEFCYNSELVEEVTIQPITRFDFDFAIIFSDILVILDLLGYKVRFEKDHGPIIENNNDFSKLTDEEISAKINSNLNFCEIYKSIKNVRAKLPKSKNLIGFVGAPWTLACYAIEEKSSRDFNNTKIFAIKNELQFENIISNITKSVKYHALKQLESGADLLMIFDSWSGILPTEMFQKYSINPTKEIILFLKNKFPQKKIIGFPRLAGNNIFDYAKDTGVDVIGLDSCFNLEYVKYFDDNLIFQGNLDPTILFAQDKKILARKIDFILQHFPLDRFIFNLGHGILPNTPIENVKFLVDHIRSYE